MTEVLESPSPAASDAAASARWRILALLATAQLLGMSLWFTASATAAHFQALWQLSPAQTGGLTTVVQLGFVAGTALAALLNVADILPARLLLPASVLAAALANGLLLVAGSYEQALALRFATGLLLAGVYPPAMKMAATWFRAARGLAIGTIVGALTVGKAAPYLVHALTGSVDPRFVVLSASAGAVLAGLLVLALYHDGPFAFPRRPFSWSLAGTVWRDRPTRLAIGGYLGHMWEVYAMWTLVSVFFFDYFALRGASRIDAGTWAGLVAFLAIAAGGAGSVLAGAWADRLGRERITIWAMLVSGACSLAIGWLTMLPAALLIGIAMVWGFAVVADSAQFSAIVTEVAPPHAVGTALTLQTSLGFLLTAGSIWLCVEVSERLGWGPAFTMLAVGPALGIWQMLLLKRERNV
ncbi:MAG TPA: MFS transporter [Longimicrobiales bacterium]|nr:MFS transporter [Longimicrobiales bacterium]